MDRQRALYAYGVVHLIRPFAAGRMVTSSGALEHRVFEGAIGDQRSGEQGLARPGRMNGDDTEGTPEGFEVPRASTDEPPSDDTEGCGPGSLH